MLHHRESLRTPCYKPSNHKQTNALWFNLHEIFKVLKLLETESRIFFAKGRRGSGELLFHKYRVSLARWESSRNLLHNNVHILKSTLLYNKVTKMLSFDLFFLRQFKRNQQIYPTWYINSGMTILLFLWAFSS